MDSQGNPSRRGRKPRFRAEEVARAIRETHGLVAHAARRLGAHYHTVQAYIRRYEVCQRALKQAREEFLDDAESELYRAVQEGQPWAVRFTLSTVGKHRGYERDIKIHPDSSPEQLRELLAQFLGVLPQELPLPTASGELPPDAVRRAVRRHEKELERLCQKSQEFLPPGGN